MNIDIFDNQIEINNAHLCEEEMTLRLTTRPVKILEDRLIEDFFTNSKEQTKELIDNIDVLQQLQDLNL